jgi:hypothetical protein
MQPIDVCLATQEFWNGQGEPGGGTQDPVLVPLIRDHTRRCWVCLRWAEAARLVRFSLSAHRRGADKPSPTNWKNRVLARLVEPLVEPVLPTDRWPGEEAEMAN